MGGGNVGAAFTAALQRNGTALTAQDLNKLYPVPEMDKREPIELEKCKFFDLFDVDPAEARLEMEKKRQEAQREHGAEYMQQVMMSTIHHPLRKNRQFDFRLTDEEKAKLAENGVVASERMKAESFAEIYYRLYTDDLPVFVTADSILHAWHRSFDAFLIDLEEKHIFGMLSNTVTSTLNVCRAIAATVPAEDTLLSEAVHDVEAFLAIGLSLLEGTDLQTADAGLQSLWSGIISGGTVDMKVFSGERTIDFSLFKPRGHYTKSEKLGRYFRAMMWFGTIDFRIAGGENHDLDLYQLFCAVLLVHFLQASRALASVCSIDKLISALVADGDMGADSLSADQLARLLGSMGDAPRRTIINGQGTNDERKQSLDTLQQCILEKGLGAQLINGHPREVDPGATAVTSPPTSFALLGQRFVWSSFIFTRLVYDQVVHEDTKQPRRVPSEVDIAFALFGNNVAGQEIARRVDAKLCDNEKTGMEFVHHRDGIPFASNLISLRQVIDEEFGAGDEDVGVVNKNESISMLWLRALRALSKPSPNSSRIFHSNACKYRQMNTQVASFTQLRHDTVLYAKQSYTCITFCEYPDGMVDPYPLFWHYMHDLALRMVSIADKVRSGVSGGPEAQMFLNARTKFTDFASTMKSIQSIAESQARHKPLTLQQINFLKAMMQESHGSGGTQYNGWYPNLFYESPEDSGKRDVLVVDVHTDSASAGHGDAGSVLHLGVGDPLVAFFVADSVMYAGPVVSSYEFLMPINKRLTDAEFERHLPTINPPQWAQASYLQSQGSSRDSTGKEVPARRPPQWQTQSALR